MFSEIGFQFSMRMERGDPAEFFAPTESHSELLGERSRWLTEDEAACAALLPDGEPLLAETWTLARQWGLEADAMATASDCRSSLLGLARAWEPDFLLLKPVDGAMPVLLGGSVCFPSSWSLQEKMGKSIDRIHEVVPGLNEAIGGKVRNFLNRLRPGVAWLRSNWGLSRSPELNQHPKRDLPRLMHDTPMEAVWVRVERQALVSLSSSGGTLFGIRVESMPLSEIKNDEPASIGLASELSTMPESMAAYKNIHRLRWRIVEWLKA